MTERRALEAQLRQSQKMEAIGQLTGGIAHDFNNLLTIILANAQLLGKALPPDLPDAQADLRDVMAAALRGRVMVKELLGFARRSSLDLQPVQLNGLVSELAGLLRRILPADVEMVVCGDADLPGVRADIHAAEQILFNLATNARDAMPGGGVLRIETTRVQLTDEQRRACGAERPGDHICLAVGDTGVGMDDDTRAHMFEPFFTTKPAGKGTGLGLATVYGLVKQHGAGLEVDSQPGKGTRFRIYFPVVETLDAEWPHPVAEVEVRGGHETILIVEDDDQLRRSAKRILEEAGYQVVSAADGLEAFDHPVAAPHRAPREPHQDALAVLPPPGDLRAFDDVFRVEAAQDPPALLRIRVHLGLEVDREQLLPGGVAQHLDERGVDRQEPPGDRRPVDRVRGMLHQRAVALLRAPQGFLC